MVYCQCDQDSRECATGGMGIPLAAGILKAFGLPVEGLFMAIS
jgi:hypothetical protein